MLLFFLEVLSITSIIIYYSMSIYITWKSDSVKDRIVKYAFSQYIDENKNWAYKKWSKFKNYTYGLWYGYQDIVIVEYTEIEMRTITVKDDDEILNEDTYDFINEIDYNTKEQDWVILD